MNFLRCQLSRLLYIINIKTSSCELISALIFVRTHSLQPFSRSVFVFCLLSSGWSSHLMHLFSFIHSFIQSSVFIVHIHRSNARSSTHRTYFYNLFWTDVLSFNMYVNRMGKYDYHRKSLAHFWFALHTIILSKSSWNFTRHTHTYKQTLQPNKWTCLICMLSVRKRNVNLLSKYFSRISSNFSKN